MKITVITTSKQEKEILNEIRDITGMMNCETEFIELNENFEAQNVKGENLDIKDENPDIKHKIGILDKDTDIYIVAAGKNLELPKLVAKETSRPVIAVPIKTDNQNPLETLTKVVEMGSEGPYSTVAINGAVNAALLACQMVASKDNELYEKLEKYREDLKTMVAEKEKILLEKISKA